MSNRAIVVLTSQVIGTDFAGPIICYNKEEIKNRGEKKTYILLFTCSFRRKISLELLSDQVID